jgi:hypothetical protein
MAAAIAEPTSGPTSHEVILSSQSWVSNDVRLATLRDAGQYIAALPKKEHAAPEWQAAMQARIGVMRAPNRHYVPPLNPKGKEPHGGRRKLKRDE